MKTSLFLSFAWWLALSVAAFSAPDAPEDPSIKVIIAIPEILLPEQNRSIPRTLLNQQANAHFSVVIENISSHPIFLWSEANSSGWGSLSFEITEANGNTIQISRQEPAWAATVVSLERLEPGEAQVREIYYTTEKAYYNVTKQTRPLNHQWTPDFPFARDNDKTVTMRAVFEQKTSAGTSHWNAWTGNVVSAPYTLLLNRG